MELNTNSLVGFRTKYETVFNKAFNLAAPKLQDVALVVNSGRVEQVVHRWLKGIDGMREFVDTRVINNVDSAGFTVQNKEWEDTIGIKRVELERDQYGVYEPLIARLGQRAKLHRDELGFGLLSAAIATGTRANYTAYDGIAFYGAHTTGRVTAAQFTNVTNTALSSGSLQIAIAALRARKDNKGAPLAAAYSRPLLIIPPALEFVAQQLATQSFIVGTGPGTGASSQSNQAAMSENVLRGTFDYIVSPYLATTTEWHLTISEPYFRPIIFQIEQDVEFLSWDKFLTEWAMNSRFVFGARALYNVAVGLPEMIYGSTGA